MSKAGGSAPTFVGGITVDALSSTIPLGAGASFTSPWLPVPGVATIRIGVLTDQAGNLHTQHSDDAGVTILRDSIQPVTANKGEFLSFHPRATWFRIVYINGSTPQTLFHLTTTFMAVAAGLTQSLVSATLSRTSLATQVRSMMYDYKYDTLASIMPSSRDLLVTDRNSLISDSFLGSTLDSTLWTSTLTGTGTAAIVAQALKMSTGATANSTSKVVSTTVGRFIAGNIQGFKAGIQLVDTGTANNIRRWGSYDDNNGYFFELNGTTLYVVGRIATVDTKVAAASWSEVSTFALSANSIHSFEISYYADVAYFIIDDEVQHIMLNSGFKGSFPNRFENNNSGGSTTNLSLIVRGTLQQRYGPVQNSPRFLNINGAATTVLKNNPGGLHRIIVNSGSGTNTATIYDNAAGSGTKIATIDVNKNTGSIEFGTDFSIGLTVVTTGANTDITVVFD